MKYLIYLLAIIILLGLNIGLFNNLQIRGQMPNLLFLLALYFSLDKKDFDFFFISLVSGLFLDFYSAGFFGAFAMAFLLVSLCVHIFVSNVLVFELNWKSLSLALAVALAMLDFLVWFFGLLAFKFSWTSQYSGFRIFLSAFPAGLLYNWLLLYPMYWFSNFLRRLVDNLSLHRRGIVR